MKSAPSNIATRSGLIRTDALVDPDWLEDHLHDPNVRVIEVDVNSSAYDSGHLPGAILWNVYRDLKDPEYALLGAPEFQRLLSRSGITSGSTVVFYGYAPAMGLWLMTLFGHQDARLLNCSRDAWVRDGRPMTIECTSTLWAVDQLNAGHDSVRTSAIAVEAAVVDGSAQIVDVRTSAEFRGERFWPSGADEPLGRAGHIPSARHVPIEDLYDAQGAFRSPAELRDLFASVDLSRPVITYCTVGGRAATAWFVLTHLLDTENVSVYDGSWAQWGRTPTATVER